LVEAVDGVVSGTITRHRNSRILSLLSQSIPKRFFEIVDKVVASI
jgi:hypothetical protein